MNGTLDKGQSYSSILCTFTQGRILTNGEEYWDVKELEVFKINYIYDINNPGANEGPMRNNAPVKADERDVRELQDMGFAEDRARQALINSRNDINRATELLLGEKGD